MTKEKIKYIFIIFTFLVVVVLIALLANQGVRYFETQKKLSQKQAELTVVKNEIQEIKAAISNYEKEKKEFEEYLFAEQDIPGFLDEISKIAKVTTVNITDMKTKAFREVKSTSNLSPAQARRQAALKKNRQNQMTTEKQLKKMLTLAAMPIKMKVEGEFEALLKFFDSLEGFKQLVTISNVEIVSGKDYPLLKCEYTLKIYSLKTLSEIETK